MASRTGRRRLRCAAFALPGNRAPRAAPAAAARQAPTAATGPPDGTSLPNARGRQSKCKSQVEARGGGHAHGHQPRAPRPEPAGTSLCPFPAGSGPPAGRRTEWRGTSPPCTGDTHSGPGRDRGRVHSGVPAAGGGTEGNLQRWAAVSERDERGRGPGDGDSAKGNRKRIQTVRQARRGRGTGPRGDGAGATTGAGKRVGTCLPRTKLSTCRHETRGQRQHPGPWGHGTRVTAGPGVTELQNAAGPDVSSEPRDSATAVSFRFWGNLSTENSVPRGNSPQTEGEMRTFTKTQSHAPVTSINAWGWERTVGVSLNDSWLCKQRQTERVTRER